MGIKVSISVESRVLVVLERIMSGLAGFVEVVVVVVVVGAVVDGVVVVVVVVLDVVVGDVVEGVVVALEQLRANAIMLIISITANTKLAVLRTRAVFTVVFLL
jgi:hypothetical protein